jgi:hypothetical protein
MGARVGDSIFLKDSEVCSEAAAYARVVRALAGGAAELYELATGKAAGADGPVTPPNPQGEIGIDLSGPPWGSAVRHPIAWIGGGVVPATATAYGMNNILTVTASNPGVVGPWMIWNRPFETLPRDSVTTAIAPYSRGVISLQAYNTAVGNATITMSCTNLAFGDPQDAWQTTFIINAGASVMQNFDNVGYVPLQPGWNMLWLRFKTASTTLTSIISSLAICQAAKRSH